MITHTAQATNAIKWIDALKGGKRGFKKGVNRLAVTDDDGEPVRYCCLGVGCKVIPLKTPFDWDSGTNDEFAEKVGLNNEYGRFYKRLKGKYTLIAINDETYAKDKTFTNMRKFILKNLDNIFIPPVAAKLKQHYGK